MVMLRESDACGSRGDLADAGARVRGSRRLRSGGCAGGRCCGRRWSRGSRRTGSRTRRGLLLGWSRLPRGAPATTTVATATTTTTAAAATTPATAETASTETSATSAAFELLLGCGPGPAYTERNDPSTLELDLDVVGPLPPLEFTPPTRHQALEPAFRGLAELIRARLSHV